MKILGNLIKRNTALLLLLSMCMGCFYTGYPLYVKAAKAVEKETETEFTDALQEFDSENLYQFTTKTNGYFRVNLKTDAKEGDIKYGWNITILDADSVVLKEYKKITSDYASPRIMLPKGVVFYIKITANSSAESRIPVGVTYSLSVNETVEKNWETENDETQGTANMIPVETTTYGTIWKKGDTDVYCYTVSKDGYLRFRFAYEGTESKEVNSGWKFILYDAEMKEIYSQRKIVSDGYYSRYLNFKAGTVLYIKILSESPNSSDTMQPIDALYSITPIETAAEDWELEDNGSKSDATELVSYKMGTNYTTSDIDYYVYKATGNNEVELDFTIFGDSTDIKSGWLITVENEAGTQLTSMKKVKQDSKCLFATEKEKNYYIQVRPHYLDSNASSPVDVQYKVAVEATKALNSETTEPVVTQEPVITQGPVVTQEPIATQEPVVTGEPIETPESTVKPSSKPTVKTAPAVKGLSVKSVKKKKITLNWKKASGAAGYQIYRKSGSGSYKLVKTVKSAGTTKWTDSSVKRGKKYTYKIRSYVKVNGKIKYGKFSCKTIKF